MSTEEKNPRPSGRGAINDTTDRDEIARADKRIATLRAELAIRGFTTHIVGLQDSEIVFSVAKWGRFREIVGVAALSDFLSGLGAVHADG